MNADLKPQQLTAIQLLAMGRPICKVAEQLQVSTMTISRWKKQPEFSSRLNSVANSGLEEIARKLNATTLTAIETLQEILCDMTQPASLRVKVALGVLGAMGNVNSALERGLQHRAADFDVQTRWEGSGFSFAGDGRPVHELVHRPASSTLQSASHGE